MLNNLLNKRKVYLISCATLHRVFSKGIILKYRVYFRFYLIKIKSVFAKLGSHKNFK